LGHKDARVHCVVLKIRAEPHHTPAPTTPKTGTAVRPTGKARTEELSTKRPSLQDPTTCQAPPTKAPRSTGTTPKGRTSTNDNTSRKVPTNRCSTLEQPPQHIRP
jgi:hypothetical protein